MTEITNEEVKSAFQRLKDAFSHQFAVELEIKNISEDQEIIDVEDHGTQTGVQYQGSLRGQWLRKNGQKYGFLVDAAKPGRIYFAIHEEVPVSPAPVEEVEEIEEVDTQEHETVVEEQHVEVLPKPSEIFGRKNRRDRHEEDSDEENS